MKDLEKAIHDSDDKRRRSDTIFTKGPTPYNILRSRNSSEKVV